MKIKMKKEKLIIFIVGLMLFLGITGFSVAWFSASVFGNETAKPTTARMATLILEYTDTNVINVNNFMPGMQVTKTFTVENVGEAPITYDINLIDVINNFELPEDLVYEITSTNNGGRTANETPMPVTDATLIRARIDPTVIQEYTMVIKFKETYQDQSSDMGKTFSGKIQINAGGGLLSISDIVIEKIYIKNNNVYEESTLFPATSNYVLANYDCHDRAEVEWDSANQFIVFNTLSVPAACTLWFDPS